MVALHIASFKGHKDIVRYLCVTERSRLKIDVQDTVSIKVAADNVAMYLECMQDGITSLMYAAKQGHYESVRILFENGRADPNIKEKVSS